MVGQPSYEAYVEHIRRLHPDQPPMTKAEFFATARRRGMAAARGDFVAAEGKVGGGKYSLPEPPLPFCGLAPAARKTNSQK